MGQRLATCHNNEIAKFPIAPSKNPYFIDRGIARKGSNQARSVEVGELESYHPGRISASDIGTSVRAMLQSMFAHLDNLEAFGDLAFPRTTRDVIETLRVA
jgi:hypothetical protein